MNILSVRALVKRGSCLGIATTVWVVRYLVRGLGFHPVCGERAFVACHPTHHSQHWRLLTVGGESPGGLNPKDPRKRGSATPTERSPALSPPSPCFRNKSKTRSRFFFVVAWRNDDQPGDRDGEARGDSRATFWGSEWTNRRKSGLS